MTSRPTSFHRIVLTGILVFSGSLLSLAYGQGLQIVKEPFMVGAHFHDFQNYGQIPYLHGGMDIRVPAGTMIYAPVAGEVRISPYKIEASRAPLKFEYVRVQFSGRDLASWKNDGEPSRYVEVTIIDQGKRQWMFRHIDPQTIPQEVIRLDGGKGEIAAGQAIGKVVPWTDAVCPDARKYDHTHLEILGKDGSYLNPAALVGPIRDSTPPTIGEIWFVANEEETVIQGNENRPILKNGVDIIAEIHDFTDTSKYVVGPYRVGYTLSKTTVAGAEIIASDSEIFLFDRLPIKGDRTQLATVIFKERIRDGRNQVESQGNAKARQFLYILTNGNAAQGYSPERCINTREFPNGKYTLEIEAADIFGNVTRKTRNFEIRN